MITSTGGLSELSIKASQFPICLLERTPATRSAMGNTASTRQEFSHWDFTASDLALDQMERQTTNDHEAVTSSWMETAACYCAIALTTMVALLMGNFAESLAQPKTKTAPILVDVACQTDDEVFQELTVNRGWQSCHDDSKCDVDDDSHSYTTESTEVFTDVESEDYEQDLNDSESDWESLSSAADELLRDICDACESYTSETQAEQLLCLTSVVCAEEEDSSGPIYLEDYLCTCGECPNYKVIEDDVADGAKTLRYNTQQARSIIRLLQAFSTYNEVLGYRADMVPAAHECLRIWNGDEDKAFTSLVTLYDEVPQLCGAL